MQHGHFKNQPVPFMRSRDLRSSFEISIVVLIPDFAADSMPLIPDPRVLIPDATPLIPDPTYLVTTL